jgi:hypothetical protein
MQGAEDLTPYSQNISQIAEKFDTNTLSVSIEYVKVRNGGVLKAQFSITYHTTAVNDVCCRQADQWGLRPCPMAYDKRLES